MELIIGPASILGPPDLEDHARVSVVDEGAGRLVVTPKTDGDPEHTGHPEAGPSRRIEVEVVRPGNPVILSLLQDGVQLEVSVETLGNGRYRVYSGAIPEDLEIVDLLTLLARTAGGPDAHASATTVEAYMPGRVVACLLQEGDEVEAGQGVVVLEAMKMKNEIQSPGAGRIKKLHVSESQTVDGGDPLFEIEPA